MTQLWRGPGKNSAARNAAARWVLRHKECLSLFVAAPCAVDMEFETEERAYEHFFPPFILTTSDIQIAGPNLAKGILATELNRFSLSLPQAFKKLVAGAVLASDTRDLFVSRSTTRFPLPVSGFSPRSFAHHWQYPTGARSARPTQVVCW